MSSLDGPFALPPPLKQGSKALIFAPSSSFDRARFDQGLPFIAERYRASLGSALFSQAGFLAGDDNARLADITAALQDGETEVLIAARGGYGATRLLPELDVGAVRQANKWLVGFSDVTALHALWARAGLCSIHGPMVCSLWEGSMAVRDAFFDLLEGQPPRPLEGLTGLGGGKATGRLFGGNLTVLTALIGTPYAPPLEGAVLLLEDIAERPYRVDRMLTTLLQSDALSQVRAIILGQFTQCEPGADGTTVDHVLRERLAPLDIPLVANASVGHIAENMPLLLGAEAHVDADAGSVSFRVD